MKNHLLTLVVFAVTLMGCSGCKNEKNKQEGTYISQDQLIEENKRALQLEREDIDEFVEDQGWEMTQTGTGLRYMIYEEGDGRQAERGDYATIEYEISLMDGEVAYTSEESGPKTFRIGHDNVASGLHEGMMQMKIGDKSIMILPSHLAFGLSGDSDRIPYESPLIYDVELIKLERP